MKFDKRYEEIVNDLQIDESMKNKLLGTLAAGVVAAAGVQGGKAFGNKFAQKYEQSVDDQKELKKLNAKREKEGLKPLRYLPKDFKKGKE